MDEEELVRVRALLRAGVTRARLQLVQLGIRSVQLPAVPCPSRSCLTTAHTAVGRPQGTKYGGKHTVTLIPGDGIGRELTDSVRAVFKVRACCSQGPFPNDRGLTTPETGRCWADRSDQAAGAPIEFELVNLTADETGNVNVDEALNSLRRNKVGLKGTAPGPSAWSYQPGQPPYLR